jgi:hypothetical protein
LWVKRKFEAKRLLTVADVPEKLVHLSASHYEVNKMVDELDWPLKLLQAVMEAVNKKVQDPVVSKKLVK